MVDNDHEEHCAVPPTEAEENDAEQLTKRQTVCKSERVITNWKG